MNHFFKRVTALFLWIWCYSGWAFSQESYEFVNKDINEILYAVSLAKNFSIAADDTVWGNGDFRFVGEDFDEAFDAFLLKNRLYVQKSEKGWLVSKIRFRRILEKSEDYEKKTEYGNEAVTESEKIEESGILKFSLDACDVTPARLFECVSSETGRCITWDSLPSVKISVHTGNCTLDEMVEKIADACGGYDCRSEKNGFHVSRAGIKENGGGNGRCEVRLNQDFTVYCNISNCSFGYVLERLFSLSGNDFCISAGTDSKIGRAVFNAENFDQALGLLCENGNFEMNESDGIYYFWPSKNRDGISSQGKFWGKYDLKFAKYSEINGLLMKRFSEVETVSFNGEQKFLYFAKDSEIVPFCKFVEELDKEKFTKLVQLKYIRTEEFLKNLPPFLERSQISDSGKGDSFYFSGSEEAYEQLVSRISEVDRPNSTIRYDLLIMQYQNVDGKSWSPGFRAGMVSMGDRNAASGILGSVLNFNLDIVGAFGMKFAMDLQTSINQSKAKVYADTTLNGINGAKINFANTNTYRYRDNNLDPETGEPIYSGITKEIVSGLKLEITGTVTGDGMITSKITASVSRQGTDLSTTTGNPPPTSEKVITTEVRVKSGEPVVLSGLVQNEEVENASRTPFISRIPLLGKFFKAEDKSKEQTELVIYLVPTAEIWKGEEKDV